ncbi:unnamed protein product [Parascedosporium putredinis]|uniref:Uncharacterized protein n=1 Tax=Parascedosporium putredinis TaxID=1442378 RepID=A0A9P1HB79_9PEZI|nr:unnamed protein product [Parascedosporium putredinis]CAI8002460.1 unnamed protein product [Parascedosporium putredinis]
MATPQRLEFVRRLQTVMATGYSSMGAWCLIHPTSVIALSLSPAYAVQSATTALLMRCFGAQAMTAGLLLGTSSLDERGFTCFGLAMIPYLFFNAWYLAGPGRSLHQLAVHGPRRQLILRSGFGLLRQIIEGAARN